ncbi:MAG: hypothetical protein AAF039_11675, partial [Bacteroidota bacterium]
MKYTFSFLRPKVIISIAMLTYIGFGYAQSKLDKELMYAYGTYTSLPREIIYLHLNKTDFLRGEQLGFKAYILDKHSGKPAKKTRNLYVQLVDEENHVVKEQLLQVRNGTTFGTFKIDSLFGSKDYAIKGFTNWSRNFEEPNTFEQVIRIVDLNKNEPRGKQDSKTKLRVSFMPEGGHFIANSLNSLGIRVTDTMGLGLANLEAKLLDERNRVLKTFMLNEKGLAKVLVKPKIDLKYQLSIEHQDKKQRFDLPEVEERGFALILSNRKRSLLFNLNTNKATLPALKENNYRLVIHNGSTLKIVQLPNFNGTSIATNIPKNTLFEGINILTVLDQNNTPLMERLCFHTGQSKIRRSKWHRPIIEDDSLTIELTYDGKITEGNLSISVLPGQTIADNQHESIASFSLLTPYLSSPTENTADYFYPNSLSAEDLDLMLLIQGWSAYDWSNIIYFSPTQEYEFENGIKAILTKNRGKLKNWVAFPHQGIELKKLNTTDDNRTYSTNALFPYQEDRLIISEIDKRGNLKGPVFKGNIQFFPSTIPNFNGMGKRLGFKIPFATSFVSNGEFDFSLPLDKKTIALDEVVVSEDKVEDLRLKQLIDFSFGEVTVFDSKLRKQWPNIISFLQGQVGFQVINRNNELTIVNRVTGPPIVYLDGTPIQSPLLQGNNDLSLLIGLRSEDIGYVEVNRFGIGEGANGAGGVIRIFTRSDYSTNAKKKPYGYLNYAYPLTFNRPDEYAVPVYNSYTDDSYLKYGVLGARPGPSVRPWYDHAGNIFGDFPKGASAGVWTPFDAFDALT